MFTLKNMLKKGFLVSVMLISFNSAFATHWYHLQWVKGPGWFHHNAPRPGCIVKNCYNNFGHVHCKYYNRCK